MVPPQEREKRFTQDAITIINGTARLIAAELGSDTITTRHLSIALLESNSPVIALPLDKLGIDRKALAKNLRHPEGSSQPPVAKVFLKSAYDDEAAGIIRGADQESTSPYYMGTQHLFLSLLSRESDNPQLGFKDAGLSYQEYRDALSELSPTTPEALGV